MNFLLQNFLNFIRRKILIILMLGYIIYLKRIDLKLHRYCMQNNKYRLKIYILFSNFILWKKKKILYITEARNIVLHWTIYVIRISYRINIRIFCINGNYPNYLIIILYLNCACACYRICLICIFAKPFYVQKTI